MPISWVPWLPGGYPVHCNQCTLLMRCTYCHMDCVAITKCALQAFCLAKCLLEVKDGTFMLKHPFHPHLTPSPSFLPWWWENSGHWGRNEVTFKVPSSPNQFGILCSPSDCKRRVRKTEAQNQKRAEFSAHLLLHWPKFPVNEQQLTSGIYPELLSGAAHGIWGSSAVGQG